VTFYQESRTAKIFFYAGFATIGRVAGENKKEASTIGEC